MKRILAILATLAVLPLAGCGQTSHKPYACAEAERDPSTPGAMIACEYNTFHP